MMFIKSNNSLWWWWLLCKWWISNVHFLRIIHSHTHKQIGSKWSQKKLRKFFFHENHIKSNHIFGFIRNFLKESFFKIHHHQKIYSEISWAENFFNFLFFVVRIILMIILKKMSKRSITVNLIIKLTIYNISSNNNNNKKNMENEKPESKNECLTEKKKFNDYHHHDDVGHNRWWSDQHTHITQTDI